MAAIIVQCRDVLEQYSEPVVHYLSKISTITFVLTALAICAPPIVALIFYELAESGVRVAQPAGCRKLGLKTKSNLQNEFDKKFSEGGGGAPSKEPTSAEWWRLKSIWIYPVKSCRGVELSRGTVIATGMEYDRQFTFAQLKDPPAANANNTDKEQPASKWEFITQRQFPLLAMVRTAVWVPDQDVDTYTPHAEEVKSGGVIILSFPYQEPGWSGTVAKWGAALKGTVPMKHFCVPFDPSPAQIEKAGYSYQTVTIWKDTVSALNMEIDVPEELRHYLGMHRKLGLLRVDNAQLREVHRNAPTREDLGYQPVTGFQDAVRLPLPLSLTPSPLTSLRSTLSTCSTSPACGLSSSRCPAGPPRRGSRRSGSARTSSSRAPRRTRRTSGSGCASGCRSSRCRVARRGARCPTWTRTRGRGT
jgi:hypothetical protein